MWPSNVPLLCTMFIINASGDGSIRWQPCATLYIAMALLFISTWVRRIKSSLRWCQYLAWLRFRYSVVDSGLFKVTLLDPIHRKSKICLCRLFFTSFLLFMILSDPINWVDCNLSNPTSLSYFELSFIVLSYHLLAYFSDKATLLVFVCEDVPYVSTL